MHVIENTKTGAMVAEGVIDDTKWAGVHFTHCVPMAAVFHDRHEAYRAMKRIEARFEGHQFRVKRLGKAGVR